MAVQITRTGAKYLATQTLGDHILYLRLHTNPISLHYEMTNASSLIEPISSSGYTTAAIATDSWYSTHSSTANTDYTINAANNADSSSPFIFTFDGASPMSAGYIRGYQVTVNNWPDSGWHILWAETFGQPFEITDTYKDHIDIILQMGIGS